MGLLEDFAGQFLDWKTRTRNTIERNARDPAGLLASFAQDVQQGAAADKSAWDASRSVMPGVREAGAREMNARGQELGGLLGVIKPSVARSLNTAAQLPASSTFREAVANTPGAQLAEDGLLMRVARSQDPAQGQTPSVRGGVFYLPEGAAQMKHYSTGKNGYGGTEKISGETLLQAPLFAKGGTGGKAPESAYDQLLGKGSYQSMRQEALNTTRYGKRSYGAPSNVDEGATAVEVEKFLQKYAPELADNADHIVQNSRKGNQLAYALQEAAVGSAVRRAGYDSVLGYSKGKSGNFLSEVFDVRESHYPDKFGFSRVHDSFKSAEPPGLLAREPTKFQRAHAEAQRNAALPVEQGGLGLGPQNTAMERAKAMGFEDGWYHGTGGEDWTEFDPTKATRSYMGKGSHLAKSPELASRYAEQWKRNQRVLPVMHRATPFDLANETEYRTADWKIRAANDDASFAKQPQPFPNEENAIKEELQKRLFKGVAYQHPPEMTSSGMDKSAVTIFDPRLIRSRFAAFDPKKKDSRDLLASMGLLGLLGAGAYGQEQ